MANKTLYFDCFSGISGDMTIGALLAAGGDGETVKAAIASLGLEEPVELGWSTVNRTGITATKFEVKVLGHEGDHRHHHHPARHGANSHGHHRAHRDIVAMIGASDLSAAVKEIAVAIFAKIAEAEAKIHGVPVDEVHFHEVGAADSIVDVVGTAVLLDALSPDLIVASPVTLGSGRVQTAHGVYPVPAPATLEILRGAPVEAGDIQAELTTPTGAGILAATVDRWGPLPEMEVSAVGYGAGSAEFPDHPNVLRVVLGTPASSLLHRKPSAGHHHHEH